MWLQFRAEHLVKRQVQVMDREGGSNRAGPGLHSIDGSSCRQMFEDNSQVRMREKKIVNLPQEGTLTFKTERIGIFPVEAQHHAHIAHRIQYAGLEIL